MTTHRMSTEQAGMSSTGRQSREEVVEILRRQVYQVSGVHAATGGTLDPRAGVNHGWAKGIRALQARAILADLGRGLLPPA
jgi:hypothetical protein